LSCLPSSLDHYSENGRGPPYQVTEYLFSFSVVGHPLFLGYTPPPFFFGLNYPPFMTPFPTGHLVSFPLLILCSRQRCDHTRIPILAALRITSPPPLEAPQVTALLKVTPYPAHLSAQEYLPPLSCETPAEGPPPPPRLPPSLENQLYCLRFEPSVAAVQVSFTGVELTSRTMEAPSFPPTSFKIKGHQTYVPLPPCTANTFSARPFLRRYGSPCFSFRCLRSEGVGVGPAPAFFPSLVIGLIS